jgi:hypothetical protein
MIAEPIAIKATVDPAQKLTPGPFARSRDFSKAPVVCLVNPLIRFGVLVLLLNIYVSFGYAASDRREYQHGIDFLPAAEHEHWLLWSSSAGNPPQGKRVRIFADGERCGYFTHDIYYARVDSRQPQVDARLLVSLPEAQEPVSAAVAADGTTLVTFEDGSDSNITTECWGTIQQRFAIYAGALNADAALHTVAVSGAHSGHVAAVGNRFAIAYSEGWVTGDEGDSGTGRNIYLDTISNRGKLLVHQAVVNGKDSRDWWPLIAGSSRYALLVWQRYVANSRRAVLMHALYDPVAGRLRKPPTPLQTQVYYYHYDVQYLAGINRFIVAGNRLGDMVRKNGRSKMVLKTQIGFVTLLDEQGEVVAHWSASQVCEACGGYHTHPFVREAQPAIYDDGKQVKVLYPVKPKGALLFTITANAILLGDYVPDDYYWHSLGTDGIFLERNKAYFASLSPLGIQTRIINIEPLEANGESYE